MTNTTGRDYEIPELSPRRTPPAMSLGMREDAEAAVRTPIRCILFAVRPEIY